MRRLRIVTSSDLISACRGYEDGLVMGTHSPSPSASARNHTTQGSRSQWARLRAQPSPAAPLGPTG
jgi:hypothetical protein